MAKTPLENALERSAASCVSQQVYLELRGLCSLLLALTAFTVDP